MASDTTEKKHGNLVPYQAGQSGNPRGRPKGSRNKLGEAFLTAMVEDFDEHGPAVIARVREEKPDAYLKVVASILPKDLNVKVDPFEHMTDEDLEAAMEALSASIYEATGDPRYAPRSEDPSTEKPKGPLQ